MSADAIALEKPTLYAPGPGGTALLLVAVCTDCATVNFPATVYGCRSCGAPPERLRAQSRSGKGVLRTHVTVHQELNPRLKPPFVVGEIDFGDGIVEEVMLDCPHDAELLSGMPGELVLVRVSREPGRESLVCRFRPTSSHDHEKL